MKLPSVRIGFLTILGLSTSFVACGPGASDEVLATWEEGIEQPPVRLLFARGVTRCVPNGGPCGAQFHGYVEVRNLAYEKNVALRYRVLYPQGHDWSEVNASYVGPTLNGWEAWYFETPPVDYPPRLSAEVQMAFRYEVAGHTYWDNNGGYDYRLSSGARTISPENILGASRVALISASAYLIDNDAQVLFSGQLLLKSLAYDKRVRVVYSTDDWATVREGDAGYMHPTGSDGDTELWGFELRVPRTARVRFALGYEVAGQVQWDNNFGANYLLDVPGRFPN